MSENRVRAFNRLINSLINILEEIYHNSASKSVFNRFFYQACRICEAFMVYQNWEKIRDQILYFEKVLFFKKSYNELKSRQTEIIILTIGKILEKMILEPDKTIEAIVTDLQKEKYQLQKKIIRDESQLKNYGHFTSLLAGFMRCSSDNFYYQTGKELFQLMEHAGILKVSPNASKKTISDAYYTLSLIHHPDKGRNKDIFIELNHAYNCFRKYIYFSPDKR